MLTEDNAQYLRIRMLLYIIILVSMSAGLLIFVYFFQQFKPFLSCNVAFISGILMCVGVQMYAQKAYDHYMINRIVRTVMERRVR